MPRCNSIDDNSCCDLHQVLLDNLGDAGRIDWSRAAVDSASAPAKRGRVYRAEPYRQGQTWYEAQFSTRDSPFASCNC